MPRPDIIVVGASAGGVEALAAGLPPDWPAAVCVVLHGEGINGHSVLPEILGHADCRRITSLVARKSGTGIFYVACRLVIWLPRSTESAR